MLLMALILACMPEPYDPYNPNDPRHCVPPPTLLDVLRPQVRYPPGTPEKPLCKTTAEEQEKK